LEGVLGVDMVEKQSPAHAPHHGAVSPHEDCESRFFPAADEALQQLTVG
jgi:hypothetical protein